MLNPKISGRQSFKMSGCHVEAGGKFLGGASRVEFSGEKFTDDSENGRKEPRSR